MELAVTERENAALVNAQQESEAAKEKALAALANETYEVKRSEAAKAAEAEAHAEAHKGLQTKYEKEQEEWKAERARLRLENTTMKGRLRAMDKLGMTDGQQGDLAAVSAGQQTLVRKMQDDLDELRQENESLQALAQEGKDKSSAQLKRQENRVRQLEKTLDETKKAMAKGETHKSMELKEEMEKLQERYTHHTHTCTPA